jgi:hypothetical protein
VLLVECTDTAPSPSSNDGYFDDIALAESAFDGWALYTGSGTVSSSTTSPHGGSRVLLFNRASGTANIGVSKTLTGLTIGKAYTYKAWVKTNRVGGSQTISIGVTGKGAVTPDIVENVWEQQSYTFTATATTHVLTVTGAYATSGSYTCYLDDVLVEEPAWTENVPESPVTPLFTGRVAYLTAVYPMDKATGTSRAMTQVTAADAVGIHVSTMRYGVDLGVDTNETFEERIDRLADSAQAPVEVPVIGAPREVYSF